MSKVSLRKVSSQGDILETSALAHEIWREAYADILGPDQIEYMLETIQSPGPIQDQIARGMDYYILTAMGRPIGYAAIQMNNPPPEAFLSKLYVRKAERGRGYAASALSELDELCRHAGQKKMYLTVNRHNKAQGAYQKMGFTVAGTKVTDIGGGYVMDDYVMRRDVPRK